MNVIKDHHNRRIDYLRLSVTDRCNLRCTYCMPAEGIPWQSHEKIMSYEEMLIFVRAAASLGISKIRLTGGEPLVRKGIVSFISELKALDGVTDISLTTNGMLLSSMAQDLKDAGLDRLNLSLDSLDPQRFNKITRGGDLAKVLSGLERAIEVGIEPVKLNVVVIRELEQDFSKFVDLAMRLPIHVRFIEYMPIGKGSFWRENNYVPVSEIKERLAPFGLREAEEGRPKGWGPAVYFKPEGALGTVGFIGPCTRIFCAECNRLRLTSDGKLRTCLFSVKELDIKQVLRDGGREQAIIDCIKSALAEKPKERPQFEPPERSMSEIGG